MEKKFEPPELEVIRFEDTDMITTSGEGVTIYDPEETTTDDL